MSAEKCQTADIATLTSRLARGEEAAFHEFCGLYFSRLLRYLFVVTNGQEDVAKEALQLTFVRVARAARKFETEPAFWNWLAVIARNCVIDELRKRNRYQGLLARFFTQQPEITPIAETESASRLEELLNTELANLPGGDRALLERKYFNGEPVRALAAEWNMTEKAMESYLVRLRRKLKADLLGRLQNESHD